MLTFIVNIMLFRHPYIYSLPWRKVCRLGKSARYEYMLGFCTIWIVGRGMGVLVLMIIIPFTKKKTLSRRPVDVITETMTWYNPLNLNNAMRMKWATIILIFIMSYLCSWIFFAAAYLGINTTNSFSNSTIGCIKNVESFSSALLFSIETQQTIGENPIYPATRL